MAAMGQEDDDVDHYEVLCLPSGEEGAGLSLEQIEKAYRTQSRLRHPDKRPDDPNATADFQRLASSYNFLRDESLRRQFDARLRGRREAAARAAASGVKRRKAVSDLEERERAAATGQAVDAAEAARREDKRKAADVKRELEEFFAAKQSASSSTPPTSAHGAPEDAPKTDKGKILKVSWEGGADYYNAAKLEEIFKQFGGVEDVVIKTRKSRSRGSAIVVMASKEAALSVLQNHSVYNVFSVPLIVAPVQESGGVPTRSTHTPETRPSNLGGTGFNDLEASVFRKLQEAQKRKQSG
uniref:J domain-containing protein n=1 Tax=Oryza meridionalis TaxID=40149 RepID=A0A0E0CUW1_9ORYZ